jgi:hypothetical protein
MTYKIITMLLIFNFFDTRNDLYTNIATEYNDIIIIGEAYNDKGGAVLVTLNNLYNKKGEIESKMEEVYTLKGVREWDKDFYGKRVIVKGTLVIIKKKQTYNSDEYVASPKIVNLIKNPKWILAPEGW